MWNFDSLKDSLLEWKGIKYSDEDTTDDEYPKQKVQEKSPIIRGDKQEQSSSNFHYNSVHQKNNAFTKEISRNEQFIHECLEVLHCYKDELWIFNDCYHTTVLSESSHEYLTTSVMFNSSRGRREITKIEKIENPFLLLQYEICKITYQKQYGWEEKLLFHCTKKGNLPSICAHNFDWRLCGTARGHKYGQGVSFAPEASYANFFGDKGFDKAMILAKVLVTNECEGSNDMTVPPEGFDTTTRSPSLVYVKYDDNTFYPLYIIHYKDITCVRRRKMRI